MESANENSRNECGVMDVVGLDVSQASLEACRHPSGETARFGNDRAGIEALAKWCGDSLQWLVYEPTGDLHRLLEERLAERLPLARLNPLQARRFAEAMGRRAKTDEVDARMLAWMGATRDDLRRVRRRGDDGSELDELVTARDALVRDLAAVRNRARRAASGLLGKLYRNRLLQARRHLKAVDARVRELVRADSERKRRFEVLGSIAGIGDVVAATLLVEMPELGSIGNRQAASLAGLAPWARESGQWSGRRCIGGGRSRPRRQLYMAALTAIRHNPDMKRLHQRLRERGKPGKVALAAVMRKLVILANVLLREDRLWKPEPPRNAAPGG